MAVKRLLVDSRGVIDDLMRWERKRKDIAARLFDVIGLKRAWLAGLIYKGWMDYQTL